MNCDVAIVLPVLNAEHEVRSSVMRVLELTEAAPRLKVLIVDECSTDDTFETACELARQFPQVEAVRQQQRRGLGAIMQRARAHFHNIPILMHDGRGPVNCDELMAMLEQALRRQQPANAPERDARGSRRFGAISALNAGLAEANRAVASFHWLRTNEPIPPRRMHWLPAVPTSSMPAPTPA